MAIRWRTNQSFSSDRLSLPTGELLAMLLAKLQEVGYKEAAHTEELVASSSGTFL